jgi:hypothetical protein
MARLTHQQTRRTKVKPRITGQIYSLPVKPDGVRQDFVFIAGPDGVEYFAHRREFASVPGWFRRVAINDYVTFEPQQHEKGPRAILCAPADRVAADAAAAAAETVDDNIGNR